MKNFWPYIKIVLLFFISRILIILGAVLAVSVIALNSQPWLGKAYADTETYFTWIWANFDGISFVSIAQSNYSFPNFAYFPLLPALMSVVNRFFGLSYMNAGILLANLSLLLAFFVIFKLAQLDLKKGSPFRVLIVLLIYPTAFYYSALYTDSMYLFFCCLSLYFARRSNWFLASLFAIPAGLTRLIGICLLPALATEWYLQNRSRVNLKMLLSKKSQTRVQGFMKLARQIIKTQAFWIPFSILGIIIYMIYLQKYYGDFLLFQKSMIGWGQNRTILPPQVLYRYFKILTTASYSFIYFIACLELVSLTFSTYIMIQVFRKVRASYGVLMFITILVPLLTGTLQGMPRYFLHMYPGFLYLATVRLPKRLEILIVIGSIFLQFLLLTFFTRGYFVA